MTELSIITIPVTKILSWFGIVLLSFFLSWVVTVIIEVSRGGKKILLSWWVTIFLAIFVSLTFVRGVLNGWIRFT